MQMLVQRPSVVSLTFSQNVTNEEEWIRNWHSIIWSSIFEFHICCKKQNKTTTTEFMRMAVFNAEGQKMSSVFYTAQRQQKMLWYFSQDWTYVIAPGENRAPFCGDASTCTAVDTWPGLVGLHRNYGGAVRVSWASRRLWAKEKNKELMFVQRLKTY